eukprot:5751594-Pyramimonas_sp.AAC.1
MQSNAMAKQCNSSAVQRKAAAHINAKQCIAMRNNATHIKAMQFRAMQTNTKKKRKAIQHKAEQGNVLQHKAMQRHTLCPPV